MAGKTETTAEYSQKYHLTVLWDTDPLAYEPAMTDGTDIAKLTEREKESLRGRLDHKTAKEIALDLGISHHAVEKRLKMARTKLGVGSSLEAARLLADSEGYQQPVAQLSEDPAPVSPRQKPLLPLALGGVFVMLFGLALVLAYPSLPAVSGSVSQLAEDPGTTIPRPGDAEVVYSLTFDQLDKDHSGYLEGEEAPTVFRVAGSPTLDRDDQGNLTYSGDSAIISPAGKRDDFYREADANHDGKVSRSEFVAWSTAKHPQ
jgi:DNA-binding CsgD family transcriptional regulator